MDLGSVAAGRPFSIRIERIKGSKNQRTKTDGSGVHGDLSDIKMYLLQTRLFSESLVF